MTAGKTLVAGVFVMALLLLGLAPVLLRFTRFLARPAQVGFDGAFAALHGIGGFFLGKPFPVTQQKSLPLPLRQTCHRIHQRNIALLKADPVKWVI